MMRIADVRACVARLSPSARSRVPPELLQQLGAARGPDAHAPTPAPWAPYRSKWEAEYATRLEHMQRGGLIRAWAYEPDTLTAAGGTRYTPDFRVCGADGAETYHEVKGYARARDKVRMRECAAVSALPILVMSKRRGQWHEVMRYSGGGKAQ